MSGKSNNPSTLASIKRIAKKLKVERGIQHVRALDEVSQAVGFQNFRHASKVLANGISKAERPPIRFLIYISSYWKNRENNTSGRETLTILLFTPWGELITPLQFQNHRALVNFRAEGPDHLVGKHLLRTQSDARRQICAVARVLQFMDATKLRPSKSHSRAFPGGRSINAIPGRDHYSIWYAPETKRYLFADEPYEKAAESMAQEREEWARRHGYTIEKPTWAGMYAPDSGSRLYLAADETKGIFLKPIVAALNKLPAVIVEATWNGESASSLPYFVSPGTIAQVEVKKGKTKTQTMSTSQRNTVGYVMTFVGPRRRPKGRMPIKAHKEVGSLLKSVLIDTYHRKGVSNRINNIRGELDEWVQREYTALELPPDEFSEMYYQESGATFARSLNETVRERHAESLTKVKKILVESYPECSPMTSVLKKLDAAVKSLRDWT